MRAKTQRLVITFYTTAEAMALEKFCKAQELPGRLIPVPRQIHAGCGLAWSAPAEEELHIRSILTENGVSWAGWQTLLI